MKRFVSALTALAVVLGLSALLGGAAAQADAPPERRVVRAESDPSDPVGAARTYAELMTMPSVDNGHRARIHPPGETAGACPRTRCRDYRVPLPRGVRVTGAKVRVLLPVGYARHPRARYPVIYLLNGAKSPYTRWSEYTEIVAMSRRLPAIFVMPEGGTHDKAGMFSDWKDGSYDWETYHNRVLLPWVDRHFRTIRGARGVLGASMGGLGALNYAARNPGLYKAVLTISGLVDTSMLTANAVPPELQEALGIAPPDLNRIWGSPVLDRANWDAHNPTAQAARLRGVELFVASGTGSFNNKSSTGDQVHTGSTEQLVWSGHRSFLAALTAAGVPYHAMVWEGGIHNWPWFDLPMRWAIPRMVAHLRR